VVAIRTKHGEFAAKYINAPLFELIPFSIAAHRFVRLTFLLVIGELHLGHVNVCYLRYGVKNNKLRSGVINQNLRYGVKNGKLRHSVITVVPL
tara:strand:+ start:630 stop:908 length:279 start_codon:yes stop_codon:yes gene_type:complete